MNRMLGKNAISARLAECFITIDNNRYHLMNAINLEAKFEKEVAEVPILGSTGVKHKTISWSGKGSATFHFNTSMFAKLHEKFKNTGEDIYFDIQVTNEDKASDVGRQTVILKECLTEGSLLTAFDSDGEYLELDMDFTFDDFEIAETFKEI